MLCMHQFMLAHQHIQTLVHFQKLILQVIVSSRPSLCDVFVRKREEMHLARERRRLAALSIQKEVLVQRLVIESLQNTTDMLGSRVSHDVRTTVQRSNSSDFRED